MAYKNRTQNKRENAEFPFPFRQIFNFLEDCLPEQRPSVKLVRRVGTVTPRSKRMRNF